MQFLLLPKLKKSSREIRKTDINGAIMMGGNIVLFDLKISLGSCERGDIAVLMIRN